MAKHGTVGRRAGIAACLALCAWASAGNAGPAPRAAPDCTFRIAGQTSDVSIRQFRGKVVYLDFWASWCAPCLVSFPFMNDIHKELGAKGLQVIAIDMDRQAGDGARFLQRHPASFAVGVGGGETCARKFDVQAMPTSFLIDRGGVIRMVHAGFRDGDRASLHAAAEQALGAGAQAAAQGAEPGDEAGVGR